MEVQLRNYSPYTRSLGLLKNELDTSRNSRELLLVTIETPSTARFRVLLGRYNLWLVAVIPGADGKECYFFKDCTQYSAPSGLTAKVLPIGGSHAELGTAEYKFTYDSFKNLDTIAAYGGGRIEDNSPERTALSLLVVSISEASLFRSIMKLMADVLSRRGSATGKAMEPTYKNWEACSGREGTFPDVRIHHRARQSPCQSR